MDGGYFHSLEAEQYIIGSIFYDPDVLAELTITADMFYDPRYQKAFKWVKTLEANNAPIDFVTIAEIAGSRFSEIGGLEHIVELTGSIPTTANVKHHENYIRDAYKKREKYKIYAEALKNIHDDQAEAKALKKLDELDRLGVRKKFSMREHLVEKYDKMESQESGLTGVTTGMSELDRLWSGLNDGKLYIVGARPSVGKTAFALNVARNGIKGSDAHMNIFSLEMTEQDLTNRMMSAEGNIDGFRLRNPKEYFHSDDWQKYTTVLSVMANWEDNIDIADTPNTTVQEIRSRVKENMRDHPDKRHVVLIDYLQLVRGSGQYNGNRQQEVSEISRDLKAMALELNIPVIALSQLSRGLESRQDKRPMLSDLRESGSIEQDADVISFLYRDDYYDKESENKNIIEIITAKQRDGAIGTVDLAFIKEYNKFVSLER